ncbi:sensor histidine kinase [Anaerolentibacter hominis]|uniref:sensor histidine kinase n=1 Tax=Anaerolentibacter hominis TaxID=3079009 RepID=UPI0031B8AAE7
MYWKREKYIWITAVLLTGLCLLMGLISQNRFRDRQLCAAVGNLENKLTEEERAWVLTYLLEKTSDHQAEQKGRELLEQGGFDSSLRSRMEWNNILLPAWLLWILAICVIWLTLFLVLYWKARQRIAMENKLIVWMEQLEKGDGKRPLTKKDSLYGVQEAIWHLERIFQRRILEGRKQQNQFNLFLENICHQILNPAVSVGLNLGFIKEDSTDEAIIRDLDACENKCGQIVDLTRVLLKIAKLEKGDAGYRFYNQDIRKVLNDIKEQHDLFYPKQELLLRVPDEPVYFPLDYSWMKEALENLIRNCFMYSQTEEPVRVILETSGSYARILVEDDGVGIAEEDLPNIFDRFYRSATNANQQGFGIGLNLAKMVVEAHHGTIEAKRKEPGTQFTVSLRWKA